ncbi:hypothetical protein IW261DRAFT_1423994 [Armillaria novae-zelandiae]|uniref:Uncharacterized protein n=1 Tax=Armillaria novae-zelandiae TaxID=153914 RepID=A0AA39NWR7_9AGAR|nr:hypothetical protein IW261DRAFT_1423994 [Armillaria novae-zelandiae]
MFSTTLKVLKFLFYSAMASLAPHVDTEPPKNTIIFDPNPHVRNLRRTVNACTYLRDLARYCPHGAGEVVIKKVEFMKSSWVPNHEFLLCHVKDPRNIPGRDTVIQIEHFNDSAPSQWPDTDIPSLQPPPKDRRSLSPQSVSDASSHSSSPSIFGPVLDLFTIFCMPIITSKDYDILSTLNFNDDLTFVAEQAAAMAMVASDAADKYNPVIFNIIVETQARNYTKTPPEDNKCMGKHGMVDIEEKKKAATEREEEARCAAEAATEREEATRRDMEAAAERQRQEQLEAQRREEAVLQRGREDKLEAQRREESLLRQLQRKDEELAFLRRQLSDCKRDQVHMGFVEV